MGVEITLNDFLYCHRSYNTIRSIFYVVIGNHILLGFDLFTSLKIEGIKISFRILPQIE